MEKQNIVKINGRAYDAITGIPVDSPEPQKPTAKKPVASAGIHAAPQKSQTLRRRSTKKPVQPVQKTAPKQIAKTVAVQEPVRGARRSMDIARSSSISRFAPHPVVASTKAAAPSTEDIGPVLHPSVVKAHAAQVARQPKAVVAAPVKSSKTIKDEAISEALNKKPAAKKKPKSFFKRHRKFFNTFTVALAVILIGGFVTYLNLPNLSVHIAAAQAGIHATYPEYHPDGYSVSGPVTYSNGTVTINFAANSGSGKFVITQTKSSWDSSALQNQVDTESKGQFITTEQQGLTIYTYGNKASWVNGGILYTIKSSGNTLLSGDQIRQIAVSM